MRGKVPAGAAPQPGGVERCEIICTGCSEAQSECSEPARCDLMKVLEVLCCSLPGWSPAPLCPNTSCLGGCSFSSLPASGGL